MGKWTRRALIASGGLVGGGLLLGTGVVAFAPNRLSLRDRACATRIDKAGSSELAPAAADLARV